MLRRMLALVLSGVLVTLQNGTEIARESWRDDGKVVTSDVSVMGRTAKISIDRQKRTLHVEQGGETVDVPVPRDGAALMNLHWAAYVVLAQEFKDAIKPTPFKAVLGPDRTIDATVTVKPGAGGGREITVAVGVRLVHVTVDGKGVVTHASVPEQGIEVKPSSAAAPQAKRTPPSWAKEDPFELDNGGAKLAGVLWRPLPEGKRVPVVIVIAGSGPVDRDGNAGGMLRTDAYRQLADALAKRGVATIRYDKRGVGQSTLGKKLDDLAFDDFVGDAAALVAMARNSSSLSSVYLFGHSEGALIALEVATRAKVDGVISAAGAGRPIAELVKEQYAKQLGPDEMKEIDGLVAAVKDGKPLAPKSSVLAGLFQPALAKFLRGLLFTDPCPLASAYKGPLTVVQGDNDVQVTVEHDAKPLAAAHAGARLVVLHDVGHPLKAESKKGLDQPSYRDPSLPLAPGVVDAVVATIK
jgi:pimeloyl-ACP methyl ester carboxylesterase